MWSRTPAPRGRVARAGVRCGRRASEGGCGPVAPAPDAGCRCGPVARGPGSGREAPSPNPCLPAPRPGAPGAAPRPALRGRRCHLPAAARRPRLSAAAPLTRRTGRGLPASPRGDAGVRVRRGRRPEGAAGSGFGAGDGTAAPRRPYRTTHGPGAPAPLRLHRPAPVAKPPGRVPTAAWAPGRLPPYRARRRGVRKPCRRTPARRSDDHAADAHRPGGPAIHAVSARSPAPGAPPRPTRPAAARAPAGLRRPGRPRPRKTPRPGRPPSKGRPPGP